MKTEEKIKSKRNTVFKISAIFFCLFFYASLSHAHKVYLFAWTEGDRIYTESYLSGNKKIKDGIIRVFDNEGNELLNGKTDENGEFSFQIPQITDLRIVLEASMGHGAEYLFEKSEFSPDHTHAKEVISDIFTGHFSAQMPHPTHFSGSIARAFFLRVRLNCPAVPSRSSTSV